MGLFSFTGLPLFSSRKRTRPAVVSRPGNGEHILVVDDAKTVTAILSRVLDNAGYRCTAAYDAESALALANETIPDLIFLDIILPGMNGFKALRQLRKNPVTKGIPVIMMSGNLEATQQFWAGKIGASDFLAKPFERDTVLLKTQTALTETASAEQA